MLLSESGLHRLTYLPIKILDCQLNYQPTSSTDCVKYRVWSGRHWLHSAIFFTQLCIQIKQLDHCRPDVAAKGVGIIRGPRAIHGPYFGSVKSLSNLPAWFSSKTSVCSQQAKLCLLLWISRGGQDKVIIRGSQRFSDSLPTILRLRLPTSIFDQVIRSIGATCNQWRGLRDGNLQERMERRKTACNKVGGRWGREERRSWSQKHLKRASMGHSLLKTK